MIRDRTTERPCRLIFQSGRNSRSATPDSRAPSPPSRPRTPPTVAEDFSNTPSLSSPSKGGASHERPRTASQDRESRKHRSESLGDRERVKSKGRIGVVIGSMYLLTGRWPDAVKELIQSANITRSNSDYVWQAKALDYLLVCLLMYAWAGMNFRVSLQKIDQSNLYNLLVSCSWEAETSRFPMFFDLGQSDQDQILPRRVATKSPRVLQKWPGHRWEIPRP